MYAWMLLGCAALAYEIYRNISSRDQPHAHAHAHAHAHGYQTSERYRNRDPSPRSPSDWNSGGNNNDPLCQYGRNETHYYDHYSHSCFSTSSSTKKPNSSASERLNKPANTTPPPVPSSSSPQSNPPASASERLNKSTDTTTPPVSSSSSSSPPSKPPASPAFSKASPSSSQTLPSSKPTLSPLHSNSTNQQEKANYMRVDEKGSSHIYMIPKEIENLINKDIVPDILKKPLSPSTYREYFAALLYAEDFYVEKWSNYQLLNVTLELREAAIYDKSLKNKNLKESAKKDDKIFVAFEMDSVPERRPFLLSRDFVYARRSGSEAKKFQGIIYRVVKSSEVLVEFEEEFYFQHQRNFKYDISFSFNRVCLKRAHQAISAVSGPLFNNLIFPERSIRKNTCSSYSAPHLYSNYKLDLDSNSAVREILSFKGFPPYLVEGPLCVTSGKLSKTGLVVQEAVLKIYQRPSKGRILICSPINSTGDILMRSLKTEIPESVMFRANAAFREVDGVPDDILPLCVYEGDCFSLPSLEELKQFRVIFSTFVSSFRLHNQGITAGHFSHIFLVDASSATEPETMIPLSSLANEKTNVILTGAPNNRSGWVRSDIARKNGLRVSYFERLRATSNSDPAFITQL